MFSLNRGSTVRSNGQCAQIRLGIHFQSSQTLKQLWHHLSGVSGTSVTQTWRELWDFISVTVCNIVILKSNRENISKIRCRTWLPELVGWQGPFQLPEACVIIILISYWAARHSNLILHILYFPCCTFGIILHYALGKILSYITRSSTTALSSFANVAIQIEVRGWFSIVHT